jgi:hypothetical protein
VITITALSQYLFEDLHEYFKSDPSGSLHSRTDEDRTAVPAAGNFASGIQPFVPSSVDERATETPSGVHHREMQHVGSHRPVVLQTRDDTDRRASSPNWGLPRWTHEARPIDVAAQSLVTSLAKKFRDEVGTSAEDAAYRKFRLVNDKCRNWSLNLQFSWEEELFGLLKQELDNFFHPGGEPLIQSEEAIWDRGRCGPGASLGANGVDFYTKLFSSDLTATSLEVYYQYAAWCAVDPKWRDAEFDRLTSFGLPSIIHESVVTFVPKNRDTLRTICTEPNLNMFAQLGLGALLEDRLRSYFGIDFSNQPGRNAELARLGSIAGAIDTIDLESASDSMSLAMLETVLPDWVFETLLQYRSPLTRVRGEQVKLHMISTMGNGTTFPLQTILFSCIVQAVSKQMYAPMRRADLSWSPWGVFGDDIACPSFMTERVIKLLNILGFQVNREKSFTDKYLTFRESCGYDYFQGHNVRGVYLKTLKTPQSRCVAINLLNEWSARWGIPLRRSIGYLRDSVRILAIPPWVGVDAGIRVPLEVLRLGLVHVYRSNRWRYSYLFRYYEPVVPSLRVLDDVIAIPRNLNRVPRRAYNPSGLLIAAIGGYLKGGRIPLALKQGESPSYRTKTGVSPFWGPTVEQVRAQGSGFWERWNTAVLENLFF